jgi:CheY-like chemotaxis protein
MSGYCTSENRREIIEVGAETCLSKPFQVDALKHALGLSVQEPEQEMLAE